MGEKGFTVVELLGALAIVGILISITTFSVGCYVDNAGFKEVEAQSSKVSQYMNTYYTYRDDLPVASVKEGLSNRVLEKLRDDIPFIGDVVDEGLIYGLDKERVSGSTGIEKEDLSFFYVIQVTKEHPKYEDWKHLNGYVVFDQVVESCSGDAFVGEKGSLKEKKVKESMKFNIKDDYRDCPNESLCRRLENE